MHGKTLYRLTVVSCCNFIDLVVSSVIVSVCLCFSVSVQTKAMCIEHTVRLRLCDSLIHNTICMGFLVWFWWQWTKQWKCDIPNIMSHQKFPDFWAFQITKLEKYIRIFKLYVYSPKNVSKSEKKCVVLEHGAAKWICDFNEKWKIRIFYAMYATINGNNNTTAYKLLWL